jgi:serine protease Do
MLFRILGSTLRAEVLTGALVMAALPSTPTSLLAQQAAVPPDFTGIVRQKMPAVVAITTRQRVQEREQAQSVPEDLPFREFFRRYFDEGGDPGQPQRRPRQALGSGFVIGSDGHIITNNHVVEDAEEIQVVFGERTNVPARLVGRDPATDIAVLKVDPQPNMPLSRGAIQMPPSRARGPSPSAAPSASAER